MKTKICKKCGEEKDLKRFGKTNRSVDDYNGSCKDCISKKSNERYHGLKNGTYIKKEITKVDDTFFENVDTESKAYWLGFLYADGYVRKKHDGGQLKLKLKQTDKNHIELFKCHIKSEHKITDNTETLKKNGKEYISHNSTLSVYNLKIVNDLINLGCVECKTQKIRFPDINSNLVHHFIRGYFDGDGCIHKHKNYENVFHISIISNNNFCCDLFDIIKMGMIHEHENYSILHINKISDIKKFRDIIYKDASVFLERKKIIFDKIMDNYQYNPDSKKYKKKYIVTTPDGTEHIVDNRHYIIYYVNQII